MSDTKTGDDKTLSVHPKKTLTLKPASGQGMVRQNFSHGRTKAVVVETKKRKFTRPGEAEAPVVAAPVQLKPKAPAAPAAPVATPARPAVPPSSSADSTSTASDDDSSIALAAGSSGTRVTE